jgi:hypothetical protein
MQIARRRFLILASCCFVASGCESSKKLSEKKAAEHVVFVADAANTDVGEVKSGLPQGAKFLEKLYANGAAPKDDLKAVREALENARNKVQDLRVAKSTFFALVDEQGNVLRNDQEQDLMAGKNLFASFPEVKNALSGKYVEARGSMPEAAGVKGADGQWVAATPISVDGAVKGLYVTGWAWSSYAYRLENAVRTHVRSSNPDPNTKMPLIYVYVVVDKLAFGAPVSPEVNAQAIGAADPLSKTKGEAVWSGTLEITGRDFGIAVKRVNALGPNVGVAILRSET